MKPTLKLTAPARGASRSPEAQPSPRACVEISIGSAEGLRVVRRSQPAIVWRKAAHGGASPA